MRDWELLYIFDTGSNQKKIISTSTRNTCMSRVVVSFRIDDNVRKAFYQACKDAGHDNKSIGLERVLRYMELNRDTLVHILAYDDTI